MKRIPKLLLLTLFSFSILLTACVFPEKEDPFIRLPEEELETISGEIFPFSVSVATNATHRLEKEGKLVSYIASEIVRLADFEGRRVEMEGITRQEKMREIFWVESVKLLDIEEQKEAGEDQPDERFITKRFTFLFPKDWEYSLSPDGTAYFLGKNDPARRVFLTFTVTDLTKKDKNVDPNVLISNLAGSKEISTDEFGRERQDISLFSNLYDQKYQFIFTHSFEEFEKKKGFFRVMNSFVEGEENVKKAKRDDMKAQAAKEADKIREIPSLTTETKDDALSNIETTPQTKTQEAKAEVKKLINKVLDADTNAEIKDSRKEVSDLISKSSSKTGKNIVDYKNLIDQRAFDYESTFYGFSMKVPYGFWFRNFGQSETAIVQIGFAKFDFSDLNESQVWLIIREDSNAPQEATEINENNYITIDYPRDEKSHFRISGSANYRDAMWSILNTIEVQ